MDNNNPTIQELIGAIHTLNERLAANENHTANLQAQYDSVAEAHNMLQHNYASLQQSRAQPTISASSALSLPKLSLPDKYDGKRNQFRQFLNSVKLHFTVNHCKFQSDTLKTGFVASLLRGAALDWITPFLEQKDPMLSKWDAFEIKFSAMFDDPHRERTAATKIASLRQGRRPVSVYAAEFRRIAMDTNFDGKSQLHWFRQGLSDPVLDELTHVHSEEGLEQFIAQCILIDTRLRERETEKRLRSDGGRATQGFSSRPSHQGAVPMVIDSATVKFRGRLTVEERRRRLAKDLCLYCGEAGHAIVACPARPNRQGNGQSRR